MPLEVAPFDNSTSVCPAATTEYTAELLEAVNVYLLIVQGIVVGMIGIIGVFLTVSLIIVIGVYKELHKRTFILSLQLLVLDLVFAVLINGSIFVTTIARKWVFGQVMCSITGIVVYLASLWRCAILFVLVLDRFLTVFCPFSFKKVARKVLVPVSAILFVICSATVMGPVFGLGCYEFLESNLFCTDKSQCGLCHFSRSIRLVVLVFIGALLPVGMYIAMFIKAKRIQSSAPQLGEHEGEDNAAYNEQDQRTIITVAILFVSLICLSFPFYLRIVLASVLLMAPYRYYIYYVMIDLWFLYPICYHLEE